MSRGDRLLRVALVALLALQEPALCLAQSTQAPGVADVPAGPRLTDEERRALEARRRPARETPDERARREAAERWHRESRELEERQPIRERNLREAALGLKPVLQERADGSTSAVTGDLWNVLERATLERALARQGLALAAQARLREQLRRAVARHDAGQPRQTLSERWEDLARNDVVAGYIIAGTGQLAAVGGWPLAGNVISNIPVDDIAEVVGHASRGRSKAAAIAYTNGFVGWLAGFTASVGAESALTGAVVMGVTLPGWAVAGMAITAGIGVGWVAKQGMGYVLDEYGPRPEGFLPQSQGMVPGVPVGRSDAVVPHPPQVPGDLPRPPGIASGTTPLRLPTQPSPQPAAPPRQTTPSPPPVTVPKQTAKPQPVPAQSPVRKTGTCRICGATFTRSHNDGGLCMQCAAQEASRRSFEDFMKTNPGFGKPR
jgi:hypothetical protein